MTEWTSGELDKIGDAEELDIISQSSDGTLHKPVTIWVVRVGDELYVRAFNGPQGLWFRWTQECHAGRINSGGVDKEVTFTEESDPRLNDRIDSAYREKYRNQPVEYVDPMVTTKARATTLKLVPN